MQLVRKTFEQNILLLGYAHHGMYLGWMSVASSGLVITLAGLHLEIDPRGSEMSIYEKEGGAKPCVHVDKYMYSREV